MKEPIGSARNIILLPQKDGTVSALVEVVLVLAGPGYHMKGQDEVIQQRETTAVHFADDPDGLLSIAQSIIGYAQEAKELEARMNARLKE